MGEREGGSNLLMNRFRCGVTSCCVGLSEHWGK